MKVSPITWLVEEALPADIVTKYTSVELASEVSVNTKVFLFLKLYWPAVPVWTISKKSPGTNGVPGADCLANPVITGAIVIVE